MKVTHECNSISNFLESRMSRLFKSSVWLNCISSFNNKLPITFRLGIAFNHNVITICYPTSSLYIKKTWKIPKIKSSVKYLDKISWYLQTFSCCFASSFLTTLRGLVRGRGGQFVHLVSGHFVLLTGDGHPKFQGKVSGSN